jgi:hypothetical protein
MIRTTQMFKQFQGSAEGTCASLAPATRKRRADCAETLSQTQAHRIGFDGTAVAIRDSCVEGHMVEADTRKEGNITYWLALRERVCSVCLDQRSDGRCGLPKNSVCALQRQLPLLVDTLHSVDSPRMDDYVDAVERNVCTRCPEQDASGQCHGRDTARCALYTYLPLVLDAVDTVDEWQRRAK